MKSQGRPSADSSLDPIELPHCVLLLEDDSYSGTVCACVCALTCKHGMHMYVLFKCAHSCVCGMFDVCVYTVSGF